MKTCAICGQTAERGSMCRDCRSALKRARDETVSQFQPAPSIAMALPAKPHDAASAATGGRHRAELAMSATGRHRPEPGIAMAAGRHPIEAPDKRPSSHRDLPARKDRPPPVPEAMPGRSNASRFVWAIVTLMVLVVSYVAYGVISAGVDAARLPPTPVKEPASVRPLPDPAQRRVEVVVTPSLREAQLGFGAQEEVERRMNGSPAPPLPVGPAAPTRARDVARTVPADAGLPRNAGRASPSSPRVEPEPVASEFAAKPVVVAAAPPAPGARDNARRDRWDRMESALRSCGAEDFLGRVICEQKVRLEYCEGQWGQAAQCPGAPANDHGQ